MSQSLLNPSPLKEGRRILSEKSANACLSPARSPAKQTLFNSPSPKKLLPSPSFIAQKRSISKLDAEDAELRLPVEGQRVEARPAQHEASLRSIADLDNRPQSTSTSTCDAMNLDVPEQTTTSSRQSQRQTSPTRTTSKGPEVFPASSPKTVPSDPETRKQFIQEKATLLRSRLQNAMRHVRDPQFDRRVSELEEHSRKYPRLSASASGPGSQLQKHLERKYGVEAEEEEEEEEEGEEGDDNEPMLSTPRAPGRDQTLEEQREPTHIGGDEDGEATPTQNDATRHTDADPDTRAPASPTQMVLSSPTYNSTAQTGRFDDDRPMAGDATVATSPSSSQKGEGRGDGDAVDGLLKLMGTNTGTAATTTSTTDVDAETGVRA